MKWEDDGAWCGELMTRNTGECPNAAVVSRLSQILEETPHPKYNLTAKACQGILRRAERRGKDLQKLLKAVLIRQSQGASPQERTETPAPTEAPTSYAVRIRGGVTEEEKARYKCAGVVCGEAADLIENQQRHIEALMKANDSLKDAIARRDKQIEDMKQGMAQLAKAVAVKEDNNGTTYEDTGLTPGDIKDLLDMAASKTNKVLRLKDELHAMKNELCQYCGKYKKAHEGACDGCRWREM